MITDQFRTAALGLDTEARLMGCEGDDLGNPDRPSVWLFGIEPGDSIREHAITDDDGEYSIAKQKQFVFNRNAFRLLARISGYDRENVDEFVQEHQPFVRGKKGFFKGNLYPIACNNISEWNADAVAYTGFASKEEMRQWCRAERFAHIRHLLQKHQPRLFIGVGLGTVSDYCLITGAALKGLEQKHFTGMNGYSRRFYFGRVGPTVFAVIPHLSPSGPQCLTNSSDIEYVGWQIAALLE